MKRFLIALGAFGVLAAGLFGSASALVVNGGFLQQGASQSMTCDTNGVKIAGFTPVGDQAGNMDTMWLTDLSSNCHGGYIEADLFDSSNQQVGFGTFHGGTYASPGACAAPTTWDGPNPAVALPANLSSSDVLRLCLTGNGGAGTYPTATQIDHMNIIVNGGPYTYPGH